MSLGGGGCNGGVDQDSVEGSAVANAISHNVIVVAAAGNNGSGSIDAPGCDTGVLAVGATGIADGNATGTTNHYTSIAAPTATTNSPVEYVASYSQYSSPNTLHSTGSWGIVAPGGDPSNTDGSGATNDDLHWIENIWTTTPFDASFGGTCTGDFGLTGASDCRTLIAGTSMATPHVAGAIALILALNNASYKTPAQIRSLLCTTADDLGDTHQGCGRLNVYHAMSVAIGDSAYP